MLTEDCCGHLDLNCKAWRVRMSVPLAAREIGEFLGSAILCHRCFTEWSGSAPCGRIVDIDIGHETLFQAIHQPVVHHVVHSTVATHFTGQFTSCLPEWVLVLFTKRIDGLPVFFLRAVYEHTRRVVGKYALGARDRIEATVRPWVDHVMLE